jgi:hypothetical protein
LGSFALGPVVWHSGCAPRDRGPDRFPLALKKANGLITQSSRFVRFSGKQLPLRLCHAVVAYEDAAPEPIPDINTSLTMTGMIGRMVWWESAAAPNWDGQTDAKWPRTWCR